MIRAFIFSLQLIVFYSFPFGFDTIISNRERITNLQKQQFVIEKLYNLLKKQIDKWEKLVYDAVDAFPDNKKDIHSPPIVPTTDGHPPKRYDSTLPTYECQSEAYYSLLEYLCQVLIPFRVRIALGIWAWHILLFLLLCQCIAFSLCADIRAENALISLLLTTKTE